MSVKERLIEFLSHEGIGQKRFAESIGMSAGYVNAIRKSIQPDTIHKIAMQYPSLNTGWLLTGEGEMLKDESISQNAYGDNNQIAGRDINNGVRGNTTNTTTNNYQGFCEQANKRNDDVIVKMLETLTEQGKRHLDIIDNAIAQAKELEEIRGLLRQVLDKIDTIGR